MTQINAFYYAYISQVFSDTLNQEQTALEKMNSKQ